MMSCFLSIKMQSIRTRLSCTVWGYHAFRRMSVLSWKALPSLPGLISILNSLGGDWMFALVLRLSQMWYDGTRKVDKKLSGMPVLGSLRNSWTKCKKYRTLKKLSSWFSPAIKNKQLRSSQLLAFQMISFHGSRQAAKVSPILLKRTPIEHLL